MRGEPELHRIVNGCARMSSGVTGGKKQLNRNQLFKRQKIRNARTIRAEAVRFDVKQNVAGSNAGRLEGGNNLSESGGILKVAEFVSSREFELKELQLAMRTSKSANSTRVFQSLPRKLRRRTASHNVKRIPKRMRNRAMREMAKNDQRVVSPGSKSNGSVFKKTKRNHGLSARALYRAKMSVKLLRLASKSASMKLALPDGVLSRNINLRSKIKFLNSQIGAKRRNNPDVLSRNNAMGSYDNCALNELALPPRNRIKFLKRQRFFAWIPSHIWNAKRSHMIKRWGYQIPWSPTQKCFRLTHRLGGNVASSDGALALDTSFYGTMIVKDSLKKDENGSNLKEIISTLSGSRSVTKKFRDSKNWFEGYVYDIENDCSTILGPVDLLWIDVHTVMIRLHPAIYPTVFFAILRKYGDRISLSDCRYSLGSITVKGAKSLNALASIMRTHSKSESFSQLKMASTIADTSVLPLKAMFAFECIDPRHLSAPRPLNTSSSDTPTVDDIINLQNNFPSKEISSIVHKLTNSKERENSYFNQSTLKQLATRRQRLMSTDPVNQTKNMIPYNSKTDPSIPLFIVKRQKSDDWVVILPWFWVLPFWYQLNRVTRVYHMGLRQMQQLSYENNKLFFPDDFPFTLVGQKENSIYKRDTKKLKWDKKAPGKRVSFDKILDIHKDVLPSFQGEIGDYFSCDWKLLQILRNGLKYLTRDGKTLGHCNENKTTQFDSYGARDIQVLNDLFEYYKDIVNKDTYDITQDFSLPIELTVNTRAEPREIDWEKSAQSSINETPLQVTAISCTCVGKGHPTDNSRIYQIPLEDADYWKKVSAGLYRSDGRKDNETKHPLPNIHDLVGFITTGAYHLAEGKGVAQGFIDAEVARKRTSRHLLIRNVGTNTYRLVE